MSRKFINPLKFIWAIALILIFVNLIPVFLSTDLKAEERVGDVLLSMTPGNEGGAGIPNGVTAVVVYYRGLDTLGEVSVLFLVSTAVGLFFGREKSETKSETKPNEIVSHSKTLVLPHFMLTGLYIIFHGHLSPGGGFQGGVMAAGMVLLLLLAGDRVKQTKALHFIEGFAGSLYIIVATLGLYFGVSFLGQYLPLGEFNTLLSGGILPVIYIFVGIKVGTEIIGLYQNFQNKEAEE